VRILHAIHDFLPRHQAGSEIYALELCRELASRHHVSVLCAERDPSRDHGHVAWRVHEGLAVVEIVNNWRCRTFEDTYRSPRITDQIRHVLRAIQPDVIHLHSLLNLSFELTALARRRGVPVVATLHDYTLVCPSGGQRLHRAEQHVCGDIDPERCVRCFRDSDDFALMSFGRVAAVTQASRLLRRPALALARRFPEALSRFVRASRHAPLFPLTAADIERRLIAARKVFGEVDLFIAPSASIAAEFSRLGVEESKIRISDYGIAPMAAPPRENRAGLLRLGYVGSLVWHKGVHVLLDALRQLPRGGWELRIFGSPDASPGYAERLRSQASGLPVHFMGRFDRAGIADVYGQIDVLAVPSLWLENSPLVIHEAFLAGVPVVGSRIGGIAGLVAHGRTGLLHEAGSASGLADALRALLQDPARLEELASNARTIPRIKSIASDARECETLYDEVVQRRAGRSA
jgi:glycosyltransferase involved in cell wall biosynthesis